MIFPGESAQACDSVTGLCARHPSQIYEALLEGFMLFIVLFVLVRFGAFKRVGFITAVFLIWYGISRFVVEFSSSRSSIFSNSNPYGFAYRFGDYGVTIGQALSIPMVLTGLILIFLCHQRSKNFLNHATT